MPWIVCACWFVATGAIPALTPEARNRSESPRSFAANMLSLDEPARGIQSDLALRTRHSEAVEELLQESEASDEPLFDARWHIDFGLRMSHTKLGGTKQQLDRRLDLPMKLDVLGAWNHPTTPLDRRSSLGLSSLFLGLGREESDWLTWTWYFAGGAAKDSTHQRIGPVNFEVDFKYATYLTGIRAEAYPWLQPVLRDEITLGESVRDSRPYVYGGLETGFINAEGKGSYRFAPFTIYSDKVTVRDWVTSMYVGMGWRFPIDSHWSFTLSGDYAFHFYRPEEYNSWNVITGFRYQW